jgi:hypothetical protein
MKKFIFSCLFLLIFISSQAQAGGTELLRSLEKSSNQVQQVTATLKSSSRLFKEKEDITSVIVIIPSGSVVDVLGSDSTFLRVKFEDDEGYIYSRHAVINNTPAPVVKTEPNKQETPGKKELTNEQKQVKRFDYLEYKYGTDMAKKLMEGKIWKGMSAEMVHDSWGSPLKINRVIGEIVREEWIYKSYWLYIEDNTLAQWGPVNK